MFTLTWLIYAFFITQAILYTSTGALMPGLIESFAMTPSQVGYVNSTAAIGMLMANMVGGMVSDRLGKHWLYIGGGALAAVMTLWQSALVLYLPFLMISFVAGVGRAMTNLTGNALVADLHPERRGFYVGMIHVLFGMGALVGPLIGTAFLQAGLDWRSVYAMIAIAQIVLSVALWLSARTVPAASLAPAARAPGQAGGAMPMRPVMLVALGMAFYTASQSTVVTWYATYVQNGLGLGASIGAWSLTSFWIGMVIGRTATMWISDRFEGKAVLLLYTGLGGIATLLTVLLHSPVPIYAAMVCSGLLTGGTWPQALAYVYRVAPHATGRATGLITVANGISAIILPSLTGWVAERVGLSGAIWSGFSYLVIAFACFMLVPRQEPEAKPAAA